MTCTARLSRRAGAGTAWRSAPSSRPCCGVPASRCSAPARESRGLRGTRQRLYVKEHAIMLNDPFFESKYTYGDDAVPSEPGLLVAHGVKHPTRSSLNLTSLPDEFLKIWHPTFLIRHPAMMLPSLYRTTLADLGPDAERLKARQGKGPLKHEATMKWIRTLYEFFAAYLPKDSMWPIVLDADDIMKTPELVTKYAPLADLDPAKLRFSWEMVPNEKIKTISKAHQVMTSSIRASSKTDTSKAAGAIDIDTENTKWRAEFGEEGCRNLEQWVRDMMPDYLAMHSKRLRLN
ncbi:uncharacterized protein C8A04DRAFT_10869 [Dichotomopilus funicola]|uniref:Uncharacterized protein n=1 Tax=Dichotomopilus funicola TaxID=1934379 RepID=A0AAN6V5H7_9PEZI|nr:hypothetical protein C8A04DRAFT_10869 [Dichotomopilus funicola]